MNIIPPKYAPVAHQPKRSIKRAAPSDHSHEVDVQKDRRSLPDRRHKPNRNASLMDMRQSGDRRTSNRVYIST